MNSTAAVGAAKPLLVRRAAVLGAGTMGSRIAAHLANAGIPVLLLDMVPAGEPARNKLAIGAVAALAKSKPAAYFEASLGALLTPGNFDDDLAKLRECDWVIEAVAENLAIKATLLARVAPHLATHAILTTNTSGLPIASIAEALGDLRPRFFGTHFFNPPRYMRLLEVIPAPESDPALVSSFAAFADRALGKQVVHANDTPNFIANRIGVSVMFAAATLMLQQGLTIEEVDALTGQAIGWPRTGTFRLADMVGIDVLAHVAANFPAGAIPGKFAELLRTVVQRGWLGDKSGQGFYKKLRGPDGKDQRFVLDLETLDYRPLAKAALPALEMAKNAATTAERLRMLLAADPAKDKAARFLWPFLATMWNTAAERIGEAANDAPSVDQAMRAGFNWELGPFEMWDAAGVRLTAERMRAMNIPLTRAHEALLATASASARVSWYSPDGPQCFSPVTGAWQTIPRQPGHARVADFRSANGVIRSNAGASLVDLGDGVACIELHSLKNTIGGDVMSLVRSALDPASDAVSERIPALALRGGYDVARGLSSHCRFSLRAGRPISASPSPSEGDGGSVHIVDLPDPAAARAFAFDEPGYQAGMYRDAMLRRWRNLLGRTMWQFPPGYTDDRRYLVLGLGAGQPVDEGLPPDHDQRLIAYGPLLSDDATAWLGTVALVQASSAQVARTVLTADRYAAVEVDRWDYGGRPD